MQDFWVGSWLHSPPNNTFVNGRRTIVTHLCFGPVETRTWFVTEEGERFYEEQILEGVQAGDQFLEPVSKAELLQVLDHEIALCQSMHCTDAQLRFQAEKEYLEST